MPLQPVGVLKLLLNLVCMIRIQGRELYLRDIVKYTYLCDIVKYTSNTCIHYSILFFLKWSISIGLNQDTCEPVCFRLDTMLDMKSTLHFGFKLNDLDLKSRLQSYTRARIYAVILL